VTLGWVVGELPWWKDRIEIDGDVPDDLMIVVHAHPEMSVCQHFLCDDKDEVNIMSHPWVFGTR